MHTYELRFADAREGARRVKFLAEDAATALILAHDHASRRSAELWRDGTKLCSIKRMAVADDHYWQIAS